MSLLFIVERLRDHITAIRNNIWHTNCEPQLNRNLFVRIYKIGSDSNDQEQQQQAMPHSHNFCGIVNDLSLAEGLPEDSIDL